MGMARKPKDLNVRRLNGQNNMIWCFKCDSQKVKPGKKCKRCGAKCLVSHQKTYKTRLVEIRLTELSK
jgi:uncharacterized membrane protein YvbJ